MCYKVSEALLVFIKMLLRNYYHLQSIIKNSYNDCGLNKMCYQIVYSTSLELNEAFLC